MRPIRPVQNSVNQMLPSGPQAMLSGPTPTPMGNWVTTPAGLILRIKSGWSFACIRPTIQTLPSGAPTIDLEPDPPAGTANCVITPAGVTRPTRVCPTSKYQTFPSLPAVMPLRLALPQPAHPEPVGEGLGTAYSMTPPDVSLPGEGVGLEVGAELTEGESAGLRWATAGPLAVQPTTKSRQIASAARITRSNVAAARELRASALMDAI